VYATPYRDDATLAATLATYMTDDNMTSLGKVKHQSKQYQKSCTNVCMATDNQRQIQGERQITWRQITPAYHMDKVDQPES
jgi:hypothetical protein